MKLNPSVVDLLSQIRHLRLCLSDLSFQFVLTRAQLGLVSPFELKISRSRTPGIFKCVCQFRSRRLQKMQRRSGILGKDRKSTRLNSSHTVISYAVFCLKKKKEHQ